uniref:Uncharacterized protein n=1 Tax=Attheya septentrionalis TaxID=420275 RepID=A0A7S2U7P3_9STRA|eukprot:CAMPEP_0198302446 /NCGR_PEP_ID=MMETSP1449-20131203/55185_1 /TAXON_ID=420275 /ORGANISM="Attheya septentrionalis, Strain CCMP2084" /LENGTH=220 /DNA_ID=CAMNT_0044004789 /DNA_START=100 /DNA_END=762 /DNA_ORIENTATION=-
MKMKLVSLLLLANANALLFFADSSEAVKVKGKGDGVTALRNDGTRRLGGSKKGSKSKRKKKVKKKKSKKKKGGPFCHVTKVVRLYEDLSSPDYLFGSPPSPDSPPGQVVFVNVPIYALGGDNSVGEKVGMYQGQVTMVPQGDCIGTYMFSFDWNEETGYYDTQLFSPLTCSGQNNPITGGTGDFLFATGELNFVEKVLGGDNDEAIGDVVSITTCFMGYD